MLEYSLCNRHHSILASVTILRMCDHRKMRRVKISVPPTRHLKVLPGIMCHVLIGVDGGTHVHSGF